MMVDLTNDARKTEIDDEDFIKVSRYKWRAMYGRDGSLIGVRATCNETILLHRYLLGNPDYQVDHKDRNVLNNRKRNLRAADASQQACNRLRYKPNATSKYKGVYYNTAKGSKSLWRMAIQTRGYRFSESHATELGAAKAYDKWAKEFHGEFAVLNFPEEPKVS
jgi:hypothetical protein